MLVVATVAGTPSAAAILPTFVQCLAYSGGSAYYAKTMIRDDDNIAYQRWSIG